MLKRYIQPFINIIKSSRLPLSTPHLSTTRTFTQLSKKSIYLRSTIYTYSQNNKPTINQQQFKTQSKQFYQNYVDDIIQLQKSSDWQLVISNISEPLIIDFYATWCQPCKTLTPILQDKIKKLQGKVKLLKVDIDKCGEIAHQLKIKSVPTVFAVFRGQGIDSFTGVPDNNKIDKLFQTLDKVSQIANSEDKAYQILNSGKQLLSQKNYEQAQKIFLQFKQQGVDQQLIAVKVILLAQCYLSQNKITKLKDQIQRMKAFQPLYLQNPQMKDFYQLLITQNQRISQLANQNPQINNLKQKISSQPNNLSYKFELFQLYKQKQMIEEGLEILLEIIKIDKNWEDKKANKSMLAVFKELGNTSPITQKYRKLMQRLLY